MQTVKSIWDFFKTELLGMSWLNRLIGDLLNACGLDTAGKVGGSVQFFIYDTIKIMVAARRGDFDYILHTKLLPAGKNKKDTW